MHPYQWRIPTWFSQHACVLENCQKLENRHVLVDCLEFDAQLICEVFDRFNICCAAKCVFGSSQLVTRWRQRPVIWTYLTFLQHYMTQFQRFLLTIFCVTLECVIILYNSAVLHLTPRLCFVEIFISAVGVDLLTVGVDLSIDGVDLSTVCVDKSNKYSHLLENK